MGSLLTLAFRAMPFIAEHGEDIAEMIKAGAPIKDAVVKQAPELWSIFRRMAPLAPQDHPDAPAGAAVDQTDLIAETLAKHALAPHAVAPEEAAWMDRASRSFG